MKRGSWLALGMASLAVTALLVASRTSSRRRTSKELPTEGPRVVILGAGFAGLTAARAIRRRLRASARVQLIDRHNYHLFTPMLFQVATCGIDPYDVAYPLRWFVRQAGVAFQTGTVTGVDFDARQVRLDDGRKVEYDHLVFALGTTTSFFGNQAARQQAWPLKTLEEGVAVRNRVVDMLERAVKTSDPDERRRLLTFVVVGGGATGVETAASLTSMLHRVVPTDYPRLDPGEVKVLVIESEDKLLGHMSERLAALAMERLRRLGVEVWLNASAKGVGPDQLTTEDGRTVGTRTAIWATGVECDEVVSSLQVAHGKGGSIVVDEYLQVRGRPGVYAVGDNAHIIDPRTHDAIPLLAAAAVQEGEAVAENLARALAGRPQVPFHYRSLGNAISLGDRAGAVEMDRFAIDGVPGWLAWRAIHLARIASFRNKVATLLDWGTGYLYGQDTARLELRPATNNPGRSSSG